MVEKKTKKFKMSAPYDIFGITPTLLLKGKEKTVTFAGCICTTFLVLSVAAVSVYYFLKFLNKEELASSTTIITSKKYPTLDLFSNKFLIVTEFK
jgi:hypothetical protein